MDHSSYRRYQFMVIVFFLPALVFSVPASQIRQRPAAAAKTREIAKTIMKANRTGGCNSDLQNWEAAIPLDGPNAIVSFQYTTKVENVSSAKWILADKAYSGGSANVIATDVVNGAAGRKNLCFSINFKNRVPQAPPQGPYGLRYYVYVRLLDQQNNELDLSSPVILNYGAPGPQTQFPDDMANPGDTLAQGMILEAYKQLKDKFKLKDSLGPAKTGKNLPASQLFSTESGNVASIEVVQTGPQPVIFVCVPRQIPEGGGVYANQWFEYTIYQGRLAPPPVLDRDQYAPPDVTPPALTDSGAWAGYDQYDLAEAINCNNSPAHWTPILIDSDATWIQKIHRLMQMQGTHSQALQELNIARDAAKNQDLRERTMQAWQSVKLCGLLQKAELSGGDLAGDHTSWYHDGTNIPFSADFWVMGEITDYSDPGMDFDMRIAPDPAYAYLAYPYESCVRGEIEQFALVPPSLWPGSRDQWQSNYWPRKGEWLQTIGRWVTDNGHPEEVSSEAATDNCISGDGVYPCDAKNGFYTEIHPPELLVSSQTINEFTSEARVIVTGAWRGSEMRFVVNPPPRPSAEAVLRWKVVKLDRTTEGYDRKDGTDLEFIPKGRNNNPNHLEVVVRKTANGPGTIRACNGAVGLYQDRGLHAIIRCEWADRYARVTGSVSAGARPAPDAYVFWRDANMENSTWRYVKTNNLGQYTIGYLPMESSLWVRPAGSRLDFHNVPVKVVLGKNQNERRLDFEGASVPRSETPADLPKKAVAARPLNQARPTAGAARTDAAETEASRVIQSMLLNFNEPEGNLGVWQNQLGYRDGGLLMVHLTSLVDANEKPIPDLKSAFSVTQSQGKPIITINGLRGAAVKDARIRVRLTLGSTRIGLGQVYEAEARTNANGMASFRFQAGRHFEEGTFSVEVLENPVNTWFLTKKEGSTRIFYPAKSTADINTNSKPYSLEVFSASALKLFALGKELAGRGYDAREFLHEIGERQAPTSARLSGKGMKLGKRTVPIQKKLSGDREQERK